MVSIAASVAWWARTSPAREALIYEDQRISYVQLQARVTQVAGLLTSRGIQPGEVVALLMKNSAAFLELALAITHVGAVLLPINYRLGAEEVDYILEHAGVKLLLADAEFARLPVSECPWCWCRPRPSATRASCVRGRVSRHAPKPCTASRMICTG